MACWSVLGFISLTCPNSNKPALVRLVKYIVALERPALHLGKKRKGQERLADSPGRDLSCPGKD